MILKDNTPNEDILDQVEKIEALEDEKTSLECMQHENAKIGRWSSYQGLTSAP